jgi:putative membrane protein
VGFILHFLVNAAALAAAAYLVDGIKAGGTGSILAIALVFGLVNALIRPVLKLLSCPVIVLTLGLFTLVLNALMLMLTASIGRIFGIDFVVTGFWPAFFGALIIAVVSLVFSVIITAMTKTPA